MKVITCASYYGSGSSALTDLVGEYDNVKNMSELEIRFLHQLDGVLDLEYHLVQNHNRQNSGHALKRFERLMKFYEGNCFSKQYSSFIDRRELHSITKRYIEKLTGFEYAGWNFYDLYDKGNLVYYCYQVLNHIINKLGFHSFNILKSEKTLCSHPSQEEFLSATREFVHNILSAINGDELEYVEVDQLVSSTNIEKQLRYFKDDVFVFVVDRDPRDVFLLNKYCWNDHVAPKDVKLFCKWYAYTHEAGTGSHVIGERVFYIYFEDMIYHYDKTVSMIEKYTGLLDELHNRKFSRLNPKRSVVNTRLWEKYNDLESIEYIEKNLSTYLYDYSNVDYALVPGIASRETNNF